MPALLLHLCAGILAGALFRVQIAILLALLVVLEAAAWSAKGGAAAALWFFLAEAVLQVGYLVGIYTRSVLERLALAVRFTGRAPGPSA
jgi:hypothetical protein